MNLQERKNKLFEEFQMIIQDEQNVKHLEVVFNRMINSENTTLNKNQVQEVLQIRQQVRSGEMELNPWDEVKTRMNRKYGV